MHLLRRPAAALAGLAILAGAIGASLVSTSVRADTGYPAGAFGYDISYPQCPSNVPQGPVGFAIIGVNGGRAMTENRCMPAQLAWARQADAPPAVYVNTNSPPASFSTSACAPTDAVCRAFDYGRQSARYSLAYVARHAPEVERYWLDVETMNTWSANTPENSAVLRGMIEVLTGAGKEVGIYSTSYQFTRIAGNFSPGLDNWVPRPEARRETAANYCRSTPSFGGGRVVMIQLWYTFDENYVCGAAGTPAPNPSPDAGRSLSAGDTAIVAADGSCLNLRSGTGVTFPIRDCLAEGTRVNVTGAPAPVGQYVWVPVATLAGTTGWVAADFLVLAPATSAPLTPAPGPTMPNRVVIVNIAGG